VTDRADRPPHAKGNASRGAQGLLGLTSPDWDQIVGDDPAATECRTNDLVRIARALAILIPRADGPAGWLRAPNQAPLFGGLTALDLIHSEPQALEQVRTYLEAELQR
jgi:hypothetical protein